MKQLLTILAILTLGCSLFAQTAVQPAGSGTQSDPYQIANLNNLYWVTQNSSSWGSNFIQTADIDASADSAWNSGAGFSPIGNGNTMFTGTYDGNGHTISNLFINRTGGPIGMFAFTSGSLIKNIGLYNANVSGTFNVGALVGTNNASSKIINAFSTGVVNGSSGDIGGLVGYCFASSIISNSYSTATVNALSSGGGLVGGNSDFDSISYCFSTGKVNCSNQGGGLIGNLFSSTATNCFWDTLSSGKTIGVAAGSTSGVTGKNTSDLQTQSTYSGWDFVNTWTINPAVNYGYPTLRIFNLLPSTITITGNAGAGYAVISYTDTTTKTITADKSGNYTITVSNNWSRTITPSETDFTFTPASISYTNLAADTANQNFTANFKSVMPAGSGTASDPYQIASIYNLYWLTQNNNSWGSNFIQTANIVASVDSTWDSGQGFTPIGNNMVNFNGTYDGKGYTISGLFINRPSTNNIGLFGQVFNSGIIKNISLLNINITGGNNSGGLIGVNSGTVSYCSSTGIIPSGSNEVGGFVGSNIGSISKSYSSVTVKGNLSLSAYVGGFVGENTGNISNCYATGNVSGTGMVGGFAGEMESSSKISDCYSTGLVTGSSYAGGFLGLLVNGNVISNFWDTQTSGKSTSDGGTGEPTDSMKTQSTFTSRGWDFNTVWSISPSVNNGYPTLLPSSQTISGNAGIAGAVLNYTDGTAKTDTADASGNYTFTVTNNWTGTVTPSKTSYSFSPTSRSYTNLASDSTNQNYTAVPVAFTISGNTGVGNTVLSYKDTTNKSVSSDSAGNYTIVVSYNWTGTVTPSKIGFSFTPDSISYNNLSGDTTNQNYKAVQMTFTISGNAGIGGAVLSYKDTTAKTDTADSNGNYSFMVSRHWTGVVTPSKGDYTFTPSSISYLNLLSDLTKQNYSANIVSGVEGMESGIPKEYNLYQNYPNPFNPSTVIKFALPKESDVKISIYNVLGQEVRTLFNGSLEAGYHQVEFNADNLSSGIYIYRIQANNYSSIKKMMLLK